MSDDVLFTVTKDHLETGLRGVPVGYCTTSKVDPQTGLHYVGEPITKLAYRDPAEVIFLLLHKRWPGSEAEAQSFEENLARRRRIDERVIDSLRSLPRIGHPMKWFLHGLNMLGMCQATGNYYEDCLNLIAKVPVLVAAIYRLREGWGEPIESRDDLTYMANFVHMLGIPGMTDQGNADLVALMRVFDVLHMDHGGGNLSTFAGKAAASGLADMYESLTAAMCGLAGPRHGKANQECLKFVEECVHAVGGLLSQETVEAVLRQRLQNKQLIYGFGHAVLRVEDPRATVLIELGEKICPDSVNYRMVRLLREGGPKVLGADPRISNPYPNVDLVSGTLLANAGLKDPDYYTVLFGMSRVVGIAIQIVYERTQARHGKGTPIIRPKYIYDERGSAAS